MRGQHLSMRCASAHAPQRLGDPHHAVSRRRHDYRGGCFSRAYSRRMRSWYISAAGMPHVKAILEEEMTVLTTDSLPSPCHSRGRDPGPAVSGLASQRRHAKMMIRIRIIRLTSPSFLLRPRMTYAPRRFDQLVLAVASPAGTSLPASFCGTSRPRAVRPPRAPSPMVSTAVEGTIIIEPFWRSPS